MLLDTRNLKQIIDSWGDSDIESKNGFKVVVDRDPSLGYELNKWPYLLSLPLMWALSIWSMLKKAILMFFRTKPRTNTFWFDGLGDPCRQIKEGAASWRALDIIYNYQFGQRGGIGGMVSDFWIGMINAQAVRNRLKLVTRELVKAIREAALNKRTVRLFSIASGSAQAVLEAMLKVGDSVNVEVILLDLDPTAIEYSREMAQKYGLEDKITFIRASTTNLKKVVGGKDIHIIEMIGFLDYRPNHKAVRLIERIYDLLSPGGKFLTANMCPNAEKFFMKWTIDWSIIYRKPKELGQILSQGGFSSKKSEIILEPHKLHALAICQKA